VQIPPDAKPAWFLAKIIELIRGPDLLGPVGVDPALVKKWRIGRIIDELRSNRVEDDVATRATPTRGNPSRFPWGREVVTTLAADLNKAGVKGYSRPTLFRCLAIGSFVARAAELPRRTKWQEVKDWETTELPRRLRRRASRAEAFDPSHARERILRGLAELQPGAVAYRQEMHTGLPDAVVTITGRPAFMVRVVTGVAGRLVAPRSRPDQLPVLTVWISRKGQRRRLAWTPRSQAPVTTAAVGRWLRGVFDDDQADPYDQGAEST